MRNLLLPILLTTLLVPAMPAAASSATSTASKANQSALGRGFGRRSPALRARPRYRRPITRRPGLGIGRFFGGVLKLLGLAYLFNVLFGWGPGGSPFGLFLLLGLLLFFATRRRRVFVRP